MIRTILLSVICVLTVSCGRQPGAFAVPPQRSLDLGPDPDSTLAFVTMDNPQADAYIVRDISPEHGFHRWAFIQPELTFRINDPRHLIFAAEFAIPEVTYKVTGPVTVSYAVNGQTLGTLRCDHVGFFRIDKPVPEGLVEAGKPIRVTFEATPRWVSPEDGAQLSFLLHSAGFTH